MNEIDYKLNESYFSWLGALIEANQQAKSYWLLTNALHEKEFLWYVPNDDNRASEGKNLREKFCEEHDIEYIYDDFPKVVSMLEVIIGLAYRCESIMADQSVDGPMSDWFWKIMGNIGLDNFTDNDFYNFGGAVKVNEILDRIINRGYERNGRGGLFPLKRANKDQRKIELWYQMNAYLVENYYSEEVYI